MATAGGSLSHIALDRKFAYFAAYGNYETFARAAQEERHSWRVLKPLNHAAVLSRDDWAALRKAEDAAIGSNAVMTANLNAPVDGSWLAPFLKFPRWSIDPARMPYEVELCAPMILRNG